MQCEVSPNFLVYHIYALKDPKDVWGALGMGQLIVYQEVSSDPSHGDFHPTFYENDHLNNYRARRSVHDQPFTQFIVLEFNTARDPILSPKGRHAFRGIY